MTYDQRQAAEAVLNQRDQEANRRAGVRLPAALRDLGTGRHCRVTVALPGHGNPYHADLVRL